MAVGQIGMLIALLRLSKRVDAMSVRVEREIGPLAERLTRVAENLQHASNLAAVQVERVDRLFAGATKRADATMSLVQGAVVGPIREGLAVIAAVRGVIGAIRSLRGSDSLPRGLEVRRRGPAVHRVGSGPEASRMARRAAPGGVRRGGPECPPHPVAGETLTAGARR